MVGVILVTTMQLYKKYDMLSESLIHFPVLVGLYLNIMTGMSSLPPP